MEIEKNRKKLFFGLVLIGLGIWLVSTAFNGFENRDTADSENQQVPVAQQQAIDQTSSLSNDYCTQYETYDPATDECFYECDSDAECDAIEAKIDAELDRIYGEEIAAPDNFSDESPPESEDNYIAQYTTDGFALTLATGEDTDRNNNVWNLFVRIAGEQFVRDYITEFNVSDDPNSDTAGHVSQTNSDIDKWQLSINLSDFDASGKPSGEAVWTLVHEFAHILTLNSSQVPPVALEDGGGDASATSCSTFFTGEGCSNDTSYINAFYNLYWADIFDELSLVDEGMTAFYDKYSDRFVTDYAASNPGEDIAESFTQFVTKPRSTGTQIKDEKSRFFYGYEELTQLRGRIRAVLADQ